MQPHQKDKGLKIALTTTPCSLSTNFTSQTMQKVRKKVQQQEKRKEFLLCCIPFAVLIIVVSTIAVAFCIEEEFAHLVLTSSCYETLSVTFSEIRCMMSQLYSSSSDYHSFLVIFIILMFFDYGIRKIYSKRHPKRWIKRVSLQ